MKDTAFDIISLNDNAVLVEGKLYKKNAEVKTIHTDIEGVASTSADLLPYGKFRIVESEAPVSYTHLAAVNGDEDALAAVVAHYQKYIRALATRPLKDEYGNTYPVSYTHLDVYKRQLLSSKGMTPWR